MNLLQQLQQLSSSVFESRSTAKGLVSGGGVWSIEETAKIDFPGLVDILEKDPTAGFVVEGTVKAGLGIGSHYRHDGSPEGEAQVDILNDFNDKVRMPGKNIEIGNYLYGMGFAPVEPVSPDFITDIVPLPLRCKWSWKRAQTGGKFEYIKQTVGGVSTKFDVEKGELILFSMNRNADNPLGRGILHRVAETAPYKITYSDGDKKNMVRFSLYRAKQMMLHDLSKLIHNGVPKSLWKIRLKDSAMAAAAATIEKMEPGQRMATNAQDVDIKSELTDIRNGFSQIVSDFNDEYNMALQSFLPKFFGKAAWTEASSITAERIWYNALVLNLQDTFKEIKVTQIDDRILAQRGFEENHTKFFWGMPKAQEIAPAIVVQVMAQVVSSFQAGLVSGEYALNLFNQLIDVLGNMGIAMDTKAAGADKLGTATTKMAQALLDGNFSADNRKMAEQWVSTHGNKNHEQVQVRKISWSA